jgi:hypothetical protein
MSLNAIERETVITLNDAEDFAEIYTAQRPWITRLKKNPAAELLEEGKHDSSAWAKFRIPRNLVSLRSRTTKRELTPEQRETLVRNLQAGKPQAGLGK